MNMRLSSEVEESEGEENTAEGVKDKHESKHSVQGEKGERKATKAEAHKEGKRNRVEHYINSRVRLKATVNKVNPIRKEARERYNIDYPN